MNRVTLITGGARSGKSAHAVRLAAGYPAAARVFLATAEACDAEMRERIARHREERAGAFTTVEEPLDPARAAAGLPDTTRVVLLDCVTVWLGNLMHHGGEAQDSYAQVDALLCALRRTAWDWIVVTNEVGLGIVPDNPLARRFRDAAGRLNVRLAEAATDVVWMISGIAVPIKTVA